MKINHDNHLPDAIIYLDSLMALFMLNNRLNIVDSSDYFDFINGLPGNFWDILALSSINSIKNLETLENEQECTILLSKFVKENFRNFQVMRRINHPSNRLCKFMIRAIARNLVLSQGSWHERCDYFPNYRRAIYTQIHNRLNLNFPASTIEEIEKQLNIIKSFISKSSEELIYALKQNIYEHINCVGVSSFL